MKKLLCLLLAVMLVAGLCACSDADRIAQVAGTWKTEYAKTSEEKQDLLESIELYEEEIALVDSVLYGAKTVTFNTDKTYSFSKNPEDIKACVRKFFDKMFNDLYEGRADLENCYKESHNTDISLLDEEAFKMFYAKLYSAETYDALLDKLADGAYNYDKMGAFETGTFNITSKRINFDTTGEEDDGYVEYEFLDDGMLRLKFSDDYEVYKKAE